MEEPVYWAEIQHHDGIFDIFERTGTKEQHDAVGKTIQTSEIFEAKEHSLYWARNEKTAPDVEMLLNRLKADADRMGRYDDELRYTMEDYYKTLYSAKDLGYDLDESETTYIWAYDDMRDNGEIQETQNGSIRHLSSAIEAYDNMIKSGHDLLGLKSSVECKWLIKLHTEEGWEMTEMSGSIKDFEEITDDCGEMLMETLPHSDIQIHSKILLDEPDINLSTLILTNPALKEFLAEYKGQALYVENSDGKLLGFPASEDHEDVVNFCVATQIYAQSAGEYANRIADKIRELYDKSKEAARAKRDIEKADKEPEIESSVEIEEPSFEEPVAKEPAAEAVKSEETVKEDIGEDTGDIEMDLGDIGEMTFSDEMMFDDGALLGDDSPSGPAIDDDEDLSFEL